MSDEKVLTPIERRSMVFYDDEIKGVTVMVIHSEAAVYVPVHPICDYLGVA